MAERILNWLAAPVVRAQEARMHRAARTIRQSQRAQHRLDRMVTAYRTANGHGKRR